MRIDVQAFINRPWSRTQAGSKQMATGILRARQMSTQVNGRGLRSANNIQRA